MHEVELRKMHRDIYQEMAFHLLLSFGTIVLNDNGFSVDVVCGVRDN